MDVATIVLFVLGLGLLIGGAELLVRGASRLASAAGISPLVVGLTVVAFGTSSPEMAVSVQSATVGQADVAMGNIVGSNIFNVLFILGLSALITPLVVQQQLIRIDVPIMIGVSALAYVMAADLHLSRLEGVVLFAGILSYTVFLVIKSRREKREVVQEYEQEFALREPTGGKAIVIDIGLVVAGLVLLVAGSNWLVDGAVAFARWMGVSELVIGLTIIAAGTSLPEVAASVVAALRKERDIAVGNVVGSNIFNILAVLGLASGVAPEGIRVAPAALAFDIPVMVAVAVACLPVFFTGHLIARWEGGLFLAYYLAYTIFVILDSMEHDALPVFSMVMMEYVLPLTGLTLGLGMYRSWRGKRSGNR